MIRKMNVSIFLLILQLFINPIYAQISKSPVDYYQYHKQIIAAEKAIFFDNQSSKGLQIFSKTFSEYDFVFVDDCIEAFQLALFFKIEKYAMEFIKKAIDNGFELHLLGKLNLGCVCNMEMVGKGKEHVTIYEDFIHKYSNALDKYAVEAHKKYDKRIRKKLFTKVIERHGLEQFYKDTNDELYKKVSADNMRFIVNLAKDSIFLGEKNLGIYTDRLAKIFSNDSFNTKIYAARILAEKKSDLKYIAINTELNYFMSNPTYIIMFHSNGYQRLKPYMDIAIRQGFWHPREMAALKFADNRMSIPRAENMFLEPFDFKIETLTKQDLERINSMRSAFTLPDFEVDYYKHKFAHEHKLQLLYGFFYGTR